MSRKNHEMIDGKLLQTDKKYAQLKLKQKEKIAKKVNTTGDLYPEEMKELKEMVKEIWRILRSSPLK